MTTHLILDSRAFLDLDDAIELEACTGFPTLETLRGWPGQVIAELTPSGRVFVEGTDDAVERLAPEAPKKKRRRRRRAAP